jgi:alcohol dehydrogenase
MKALVYQSHGKIAWEEKPGPDVQHPGDAIVRLTTATICGTDLHILQGDLPTVTDRGIWAMRALGWSSR